MKYRLKRDLPFAKAGEPVFIDKYYEVWIDGNAFEERDKRTKIHLGGITRLSHEGWIEEVKPREWNIDLDKFGNIIGVKKREDVHYTPISGMPRMEAANRSFEIIKVREVVE